MMSKGFGQPLDATASSRNSASCPLVQEGRRGSYKKPQATQAHLISWGNYGANCPKDTSMHIKDKKGTGEIIREAPRSNPA